MTHTRPLLWSLFLILCLALSLAWALLPSLQSHPLFRIPLFAGIGLSMIGLIFSFPEISAGKSRLLIVAAAVVIRLVLLPAPVSDDVHRYIWEGQLVASGENPFAAPADDEMWSSLRNSHWEQMNHLDRPTAYPPGAQWFMAGAASTPNPSLTFKIIALGADLITLVLILLLLRRDHLPTRWAGFYAFNPIVLIAFAAEAHYDSLMVAAIVGALYAATSKHFTLSFALLAVAVQLKFVAIILLPLVVIRGMTAPAMIRGFLVFLTILILPSIHFLSSLPTWFHGLANFANTSAFNGPLFTLISLSGLAPEQVRPLCYTAFAIGFLVLMVARFRGLSLIDSSHVALTLLLLCSPIVHFWYVAWLLPLVALRPSFGWSIASITLAGYFFAWHTEAHLGWWGYGHLVAMIIWLPALLAFAAQHRQLIPRVFSHFRKSSAPATRTPLGIVIPTLNPGPGLPALVDSLRQEANKGTPLVLADASKTPPPPSSANLLSCPRGRGSQIAAGIDAIDSEWILIAHADTTPRDGWHEHLIKAIDHHPQASMFVFGQRFDQRSPGTLIVEILNELRVVFGGVAFGDQTMVIRRSALEACGGFPDQPLMEDVEASLRLHTRGRIIYLGHEWTVSAIKWKKAFSQRFLTVIRLVATYQLARLGGRRRAATCAERLYREYYS
ncbi:glycosyltransferase [Haloferula sp.]|uniref:glycosyltransferase n=1 Tax=Haloferula sp. TaxID=2497595 RepID=UPI0032A00E10